MLPKVVSQIVLVFTTLCIVKIRAARLNQFINHFETLDYSRTDLSRKHERARRSVNHANLLLEFSAHEKHFKLRLKRDAPMFSKNLVIESSEGTRRYTPDHIYVGTLEDEPGSSCHGSIINDTFRGRIITGEDEYFIEPAHRYFDTETDFHSVIYMSKHIEPPSELYGCGAKDQIHERMEDFLQENVNAQPVFDENVETPAEKYSASQRHKRATVNYDYKGCPLYLQADHTYTALFNNDENEVIAELHDHVTAVNSIYENTRFGSGWGVGIGFEVDRIRINGTQEQADPSNPFGMDNIGVEKFLELNSLQNHDAYCLAYVFADRDFNDGVLGLAWVGSSGGTSGGICEKYKKFTGGWQSLNTGIVTVKNYGQRVPPKVSHITFAHELGHNFGSPHDYRSDCRPGDSSNSDMRRDGNYIMYASATSGDRVNNNLFSDCSNGNITKVLDAKAVPNCFVELTGDREVCGNRIVEGSEECDCGYTDQCEDKCCTARSGDSSQTNQCTLNIDASCSPSQGQCCNASSCEFIGTNVTKCRSVTECSDESSCNGMEATCPGSTHKPNQTYCNSHKQICYNGECSGSVCDIFTGFEACYCSLPQNPSEEDNKRLCHICCQEIGNEDTCMSSTQIPDMAELNSDFGETYPDENTNDEKILFQPAGTPCNNFNGYCDVFYKCRDVDSSGPLSRLTTALLNPELYQDIADWIKQNWWATALIALAIVLVMGLFIACCSVHTPSSNPNMKKARDLPGAQTLRRRRKPQAGGPQQGRPQSRPQSRPQQSRPQSKPQGRPPPYNLGDYEMA